ncbi:MAG: hypothetical protein AAGG51_15285 [Cyanobacteria bacterium P01_G01_bin.54]
MNQLVYPHVLVVANTLRDERNDEIYPEALTPPEVQQQPGAIADYTLETFRSPRRLEEDTDSLLLGCALDLPHQAPNANYFGVLHHQTNHQLQAHYPQGKPLGESWILAGYLPDQNAELPETYAQAAYEALEFGRWPNQPPPLANRLGGAYWYEVETPTTHVWLVIYGNFERFKQLAQHQEQWRRLLCYRHKIQRSYDQTRSIKPQLLKKELTPGELIVQLNQGQPPRDILALSTSQIEQFLDRNIRTVGHYHEKLRALEYNQQTIRINLYNYRQLLRYLEQSNPGSQLTPLTGFSTTAKKFYLAQVKADIAVLAPELRTRESWISTIQGVVDIERSKRDRNFQRFVESAGMGLGTAGLTSTVVSPYLQSYAEQNKEQVNPYYVGTIHLLSCLLVGFMFFGITAWWRSRSQRSRP